MSNLLMISGFGANSLADGKRGAFYNTLEEFHKYWNRIDIICPKSRKSNPKVQIFENVYIHPSPWPLWLQPFWILKKGRELHRKRKFDLITAHEYPPFYNGIGAKMLHGKIGVPYVLEIMHVPGHPKAAGFKEGFYKRLTEWFIKYDSSGARAVRIINKNQARGFLLKAGIPADKLVYIQANYIDLDIFKPLSGIKKEFDIVFVARLERNKGVDLLLDAVKIIKGKKPDIRLLLIGTGPEYENLRRKIKNLELDENVVFSGWLPSVEDVAEYYNKARVFVNPSLNEGGPRVALEAMACGLPLVTTPVGIMPDIIRDGENGMLVDWQPERIADSVLCLLGDTALRDKFSRSGLELATQFEKKAAVKRYAERLKQLI